MAPSFLRRVDEQGPDQARQMIGAGEARDFARAFRDEEDRVVAIPGDVLIGHLRRIAQDILMHAHADGE
jgi:hypothetical protein